MKKILIAFSALITVLIGFSSSAFGAWKTESIGGLNTVYTYTPTTVSSVGDGRALLIVLHGCTQAASAFKTANLDDAAEEYGMVVAAPEAAYKQGFGCWGYWTGGIARTSGDYKNVLNLAETLTNRSELDIDPNQVYIAGLSSGGAFAMTLGCLAPDVFAGMGLDAAPSAGTSSMGAIGMKESTAAQTASRCKSYAGSYAGDFNTQITSTAYGTSDYIVNTGYGLQNAEAMASIYGVTKQSGTNTLQTGVTETLWSDNRVSMVVMNGVSHAWPGGSGAGGSYIDGRSINYGSYLGEFFAQNNMRVEGVITNPGEPSIESVKIDVSEDKTSVTISGYVYPDDGTVLDSVTVSVDGVEVDAPTDGYFSEEFSTSIGTHSVVIEAVGRADDVLYPTQIEKSFTVEDEPTVERPSWCVYIPEQYWVWVPMCNV